MKHDKFDLISRNEREPLGFFDGWFDDFMPMFSSREMKELLKKLTKTMFSKLICQDLTRKTLTCNLRMAILQFLQKENTRWKRGKTKRATLSEKKEDLVSLAVLSM